MKCMVCTGDNPVNVIVPGEGTGDVNPKIFCTCQTPEFVHAERSLFKWAFFFKESDICTA